MCQICFAIEDGKYTLKPTYYLHTLLIKHHNFTPVPTPKAGERILNTNKHRNQRQNNDNKDHNLLDED